MAKSKQPTSKTSTKKKGSTRVKSAPAPGNGSGTVMAMPQRRESTAAVALVAPAPIPVQNAPKQEGRYVYGVVESREPGNYGRIGIGGTGVMVYTFHNAYIAAIVSKTPVFIFDPPRENALD